MRNDEQQDRLETAQILQALARQDAVFEDREWAPAAVALDQGPAEAYHLPG